MNKIKRLIKKIPHSQDIYDKFRDKLNYLDFYKDKSFFKKNYMYSKPITKEKLEYEMLFEIHKLEKGFTVSTNIRPFGKDKIHKIIKDIRKYELLGFEPSFAYKLSYSVLREYLKFFEMNEWTDRDEYKTVLSFVKEKKEFKCIPVGAFDLKKEEFIDKALIDYNSFLSSRRSVRNFLDKKLTDEDIKKAVDMAIKTPTACNRQMCKIYFLKTEKSKNIIKKYAQGLSLFDLKNANYFMVTFDVSANYFVGERNQGWFNSGLVTMNFVNALHSLGIGSCCIQFGNTFTEEKKLKRELNISNSERIGVIITAGYYDEISRIPYSTRKPIEEIYRER